MLTKSCNEIPRIIKKATQKKVEFSLPVKVIPLYIQKSTRILDLTATFNAINKLFSLDQQYLKQAKKVDGRDILRNTTLAHRFTRNYGICEDIFKCK